MNTSKTKRKNPLIILCIVIVAGLTFLWLGNRDVKEGQNQQSTSTLPSPSLTISTITPQTEAVTRVIQANGNIQPWHEAIVSTEVGGIPVTEVLVDIGDTVKKGQLLARLDSDILKAEYQQALANYEIAKADAGRARTLENENVLSEQELTRIFAQEKTTRAQYDIANKRLQDTKIYAPDSGVISARLVTLGSVPTPGQPLFHLIRQSRLEWQAEVTSSEINRIQIGDAVEIETTGGIRTVGKVRAIAPNTNLQKRIVLVYVELPKNIHLKAGMFANGRFILKKEQVLMLPQQALSLRDGFHYVFIPKAIKTEAIQMGSEQTLAKIQQHKVETGVRVGDKVEITSSLNPKQKVAASGVGFLGDGDIVRVN
jgi:RND family efflux transporter MFP subunit